LSFGFLFQQVNGMKLRVVLGVLVAVVTLAVPARSEAAGIGILQQISPTPTTYALGVGLDFVPLTLSGLGDVTGQLQAVNDLVLPVGVNPANTSNSGCEAGDFSPSMSGRIALIQRGTCSFEIKTANAFAAGAIAAIIFNEGQAGRTDAIDSTNGSLGAIPVVFISFALGNDLANLLFSGQVVPMRVEVSDNNTSVPVPEPGTLTLAVLGLGLSAGAVRRRARARRQQ